MALNLPVAGSTNAIDNISYTFSELGSGLTTTQFLIQDIVSADTGTWRSFNANGTLATAGAGQVWLSSAADPKTIFNAETGSLGVTISSFSPTTVGIRIPQFEDGHKYRISARATDVIGAAHEVNSSTFNNHSAFATLIYDVTRPTLTVLSPTASGGAPLATSSGAASYVSNFSVISGSITDNVADALDRQMIFIRVAELIAGAVPEEAGAKWLRPADLVLTSAIGPDEAWKALDPKTLLSTTTAEAWSWSLIGAGFSDGLLYRIEVYAADSAGNSTGTALSPLYKRYLKLDQSAPALLAMNISTGSATDNASVLHATYPFVGLYLSSSPLNRISLSWDDGTGSGIGYVKYSLCFDKSGTCDFQWNPAFSTTTWENTGGAQRWVTAGSTNPIILGQRYEVALASSVAWLEGRDYYLVVKATDVAGNEATVAWRFTYDFSVPSLTGLSITSGTTFGGSPLDLPDTATGTVRDQPTGLANAGAKFVYVGVQRMSGSKLWWRDVAGLPGAPDFCSTLPGDGNWCAKRADFPMSDPFPSNKWIFNRLGIENSSFWNNRSTETYYMYVWAHDNVPDPARNWGVDGVHPFTNVSSSMTLAAVFHWETQAPSSTFVSPIHDVWYSSHSGYNLPAITATSFDLPVSTWGAGAAVLQEEVQIQNTQIDPAKCWDGSDFTALCADEASWQVMPGAGPYDYDTNHDVTASGLWSKLGSGKRYRLRVRGKDTAKNSGLASNPNTEVPPSPIYPAYGINAVYFKVDKDPPATRILVPDQTDQTNPLTVSGDVSDNSMSGSSQTFVDMCQQVEAGDCAGVTTPDFGNCLQSTGTASFGGGQKYLKAAMAGSEPTKTWSLSIAPINWVTNKCYHVVAYSSDAVHNRETSAASYAATSSHIRFKKVAPGAIGTLAVPLANVFYKPTNLGAISGTASGGGGFVQVIIRDTETPNGWWNGASWLSISTYAPATPALVTVDGANNWTYSPGAGFWRVNRNYDINFRQCDAAGAAGAGNMLLSGDRPFVIDSSAPVVAMTWPDTTVTAYNAGKLKTSSATVSEVGRTAPNQASSLDTVNTNTDVFFRVVRKKPLPVAEWDVGLSTFVAPPGTNLKAEFISGTLWRYSTDYMVTGQMWENGREYEIRIYARDKAGNGAVGPGIPDNGNDGVEASAAFRYDVSFPTASIAYPLQTAVMNSLDAFRGSVLDPDPNASSEIEPAGIAAVDISIQQLSDGNFFDGSNFNGTRQWFPASFSMATVDAGTWSFTAANNANLFNALQSDRYSVTVRARDIAGNEQYNFTGNSSSFTFTVDKDTPSVVVASPNQNTRYYTPLAANATGLMGI
ncbi:MAG: hypothetical protein AAB262_15045, partial [Elusimicrobiota bacterium]